MEPAVGVHPTGGNEVEPFRSLHVTRFQFRPQVARIRANLICLEQVEPVVVLDPDLKFLRFFEDTYKDRVSRIQTFLAERFFYNRPNTFDDFSGPGTRGEFPPSTLRD